MTLNWKLLGLPALLSATLATTTAFAAPPDKPVPPTETVKTDAVAKQLEELKSAIDKLTSVIASLKTDIVNTNISVDNTQRDLTRLKGQLAQLQQEVEDLRKLLPAKEHIAKFRSEESASGQVLLANTFSEPVTIIVNSKRYRVAPGKIIYTQPLPAGYFTYEVVGIQPVRRPFLRANETMTINVHYR